VVLVVCEVVEEEENGEEIEEEENGEEIEEGSCLPGWICGL